MIVLADLANKHVKEIPIIFSSVLWTPNINTVSPIIVFVTDSSIFPDTGEGSEGTSKYPACRADSPQSCSI